MASNEAEDDHNNEGENPGEATLLVSEFPPPPFYYKAAAHLEPPEIPFDALARGTKRAAAFAAGARAESERLRLGDDDPDKTDAILGGSVPTAPGEDEEGDVVAVFGEIVEDPVVVEPLEPCENPTVIRDEVKRLNREVIQGFVNLVQELVHRPMDNKKMRDELSHNVFLMLQECNKFREHQARELLIDLLEQELSERRKLAEELKTSIAKADELLLGEDSKPKEEETATKAEEEGPEPMKED
ncbi:expressed unknown protein [Seminavis robusta]|uniref:Mediator of RNA polymerase II transcription subunit 7 n=1 Tax=Seminavis robusta TaxID=568900 RepID=A0A9N8EUU6_9STRA|nr:expressed unknown protein [Seminavis robusta]|eukprot:Sro1826_g300170.1 n/a (243) ;mRNA; r:20224-21167